VADVSSLADRLDAEFSAVKGKHESFLAGQASAAAREQLGQRRSP
jgi:hypothetical protein